MIPSSITPCPDTKHHGKVSSVRGKRARKKRLRRKRNARNGG